MKGKKTILSAAVIMALGLTGNALALKPGCTAPPCGGGSSGGGGGETGETGASNLSFPVILTDGVAPTAFPQDGPWRFDSITGDPSTQCATETNTGPVNQDVTCYYGRQVSVASETGALSFSGTPKVWWLQKRPANFWKAFSVAHTSADTKLAVSAVDVGDLLESSPTVNTRIIRTEFNLLQHVTADDPEFGQFVVTDWSSNVPSPCVIPTETGQSDGCFAAVAMSGAVPGTEQSGNEIQGTDFGPGSGAGDFPGSRTFIDPASVRTATDENEVPIPVQAIDYSDCARLVVQKIEGTPMWDPALGQWSGPGVGSPEVDVAAYTGAYSVEINSGGGLVYGYNWDAKTAAPGTYRLTFVLDGNDSQGPQCAVPLTTEFKSGVTKLVNVGENNASHILYAGDSQLGDEGGLAYVDVTVGAKGGGGGGGNSGNPGGGGRNRP